MTRDNIFNYSKFDDFILSTYEAVSCYYNFLFSKIILSTYEAVSCYYNFLFSKMAAILILL